MFSLHQHHDLSKLIPYSINAWSTFSFAMILFLSSEPGKKIHFDHSFFWRKKYFQDEESPNLNQWHQLFGFNRLIIRKYFSISRYTDRVSWHHTCIVTCFLMFFFIFSAACLFRYNALSFIYLLHLLLIPLFPEPSSVTMQGKTHYCASITLP